MKKDIIFGLFLLAIMATGSLLGKLVKHYCPLVGTIIAVVLVGGGILVLCFLFYKEYRKGRKKGPSRSCQCGQGDVGPCEPH